MSRKALDDCLSAESLELCQRVLSEEFVSRQLAELGRVRPDVRLHSNRVTGILAEFVTSGVVCMGENWRLSTVRNGFLHDIGKIETPRELLDKAGALTSQEWDSVHKHPVTGYFKCMHTLGARAALPILRHHSLQRTAYPSSAEQLAMLDSLDLNPNDLVAEDIAVSTTMLVIADQIEALTSGNRYYIGDAYEPNDAIKEVRENFAKSAIFQTLKHDSLLDSLLNLSQERILQ